LCRTISQAVEKVTAGVSRPARSAQLTHAAYLGNIVAVGAIALNLLH